jgi:hypothetical protein
LVAKVAGLWSHFINSAQVHRDFLAAAQVGLHLVYMYGRGREAKGYKSVKEIICGAGQQR